MAWHPPYLKPRLSFQEGQEVGLPDRATSTVLPYIGLSGSLGSFGSITLNALNFPLTARKKSVYIHIHTHI